MNDILFHYQQINPTTWAYVSSLITIGLFFKFSRFWSVRNLDLLLLILLAPGFLLVLYGDELEQLAARDAVTSADDAGVPGASLSATPPPEMGDGSLANDEGRVDTALSSGGDAQPADIAPADTADVSLMALVDAEQPGQNTKRLGYIWLFTAGSLLLLRLLVDVTMVRRPLLDPNLTMGGLTFVGCSLFAFLMANVITGQPTEEDLKGAKGAEQLIARQEATEEEGHLTRHGPGLPLLNVLPSIATTLMHANDGQPTHESRRHTYEFTAKTMAILSHLAVVLGMVFVGYRHFDNIRMGIGAAVLYLLLPYTAQMTGRVDHVLPGALLVWAVASYRRPEIAGIFLGLAAGVVYYPLFLLPLWISFYWQRGLVRFLVGTAGMLAVVILSLVLTSSDAPHFFQQFRRLFGIWLPTDENLYGIWTYYDAVYRYPVMAAFFGLSATLALWPAQKNLGTLISCTASIMLAAQFWHGHGGGLYMAWYLPLLLLTIFRPNLEDRVALAVLGQGWLPRRRAQETSVDKAA